MQSFSHATAVSSKIGFLLKFLSLLFGSLISILRLNIVSPYETQTVLVKKERPTNHHCCFTGLKQTLFAEVHGQECEAALMGQREFRGSFMTITDM